MRFITGNKILRILKSKGLAPDIPEDLYFLIKKAVSIRKHLEKNRKDRDAKFRLILVESRIHRLARYFFLNQAAQAVIGWMGGNTPPARYPESTLMFWSGDQDYFPDKTRKNPRIGGF